eukprot:gene6109-12368_t
MSLYTQLKRTSSKIVMVARNVTFSRREKFQRMRYFITGLIVMSLLCYALLYWICLQTSQTLGLSTTRISLPCWNHHKNSSYIPLHGTIILNPRPLIIANNNSSNSTATVDAGTCISYYHSATNELQEHCLPSFAIVGAMKAGTGALMKWLNLHPYLMSGKGSEGKREIHFFGQQYEEAQCKVCEYAKHFVVYKGQKRKTQTQTQTDSQQTPVKTGGNRLRPVDVDRLYTFDKSPDYMRDRDKLLQMKTLLPSLRIVVLLRNPVSRAYSGFRHNCRHHRYSNNVANNRNNSSLLKVLVIVE